MSEEKTYTQTQLDEIIGERTAKIREARNSLQAELETLRTTSADWEKKTGALQAELETLTEVRTQLDGLQTKHAEAQTRWGQDRVLLTAGISDADAGDVLRRRYAAAENPGEFQDWFEQEGRQIPLIASYLSPPQPKADASQVQPTAEPPAQATTPAAPAMPQSNNGRKPAPPAAQPYTPGSIAGMSREEFRAQKDSLMSGVKFPF
jgi:hypothetical protein